MPGVFGLGTRRKRCCHRLGGAPASPARGQARFSQGQGQVHSRLAVTPMPPDASALPLLVAVATKDRQQIDQHFGHADVFAIYALDTSGAIFAETREVAHYCQGGYGDEDKREVILRTLADCSALFTARIGDGPRSRLAAAGITAVDDYPYGAIEPSLCDWFGKR